MRSSCPTIYKIYCKYVGIMSSIIVISFFKLSSSSKSTICRTTCGDVPINYPFSIDDGCGSPYYRHLLLCNPSSSSLLLRTPSGKYPVLNISYSDDDPTITVSDPTMFTSCKQSSSITWQPPFALDTSTHLTLSPENTFLFLNCSPSNVLIEPKLEFCRRYPDRCGGDTGAVCDSGGYLCRDIPKCPDGPATCCEYFPEATESIRLMMRHCEAYTSMYWKKVGGGVDEVAEYGIRVEFEIPATERCRRCQDEENGGGGMCGFDTATAEFLCLCNEGNLTTHCGDGGMNSGKSNTGVIVGTTTAVSVAGIASAGVLVWFLKKLKTSKVACGVQTNENRLF